MENLPVITDKHIREQFKALNQSITQGQVQQWLDEQLTALQTTNPTLYKFLTDRANKFAMGALAVSDPQSIAVSIALEYMLILGVINLGIGSSVTDSEFSDTMSKWFGTDGLKGLDKLDDGESKKA